MSAPASPTRVNRKANEADSAITRKSQASAITAPAPAATPLIAAMTGSGHSRSALTTLPVIRVNSSSSAVPISCSGPMISSTSPPEEKPRPSPVITSTRTSPRCGQLGDEVAQVGVGLEGEGVELLGPVERDRRHAVGSTVNSKCCHSPVSGALARNGLMPARRYST